MRAALSAAARETRCQLSTAIVVAAGEAPGTLWGHVRHVSLF